MHVGLKYVVSSLTVTARVRSVKFNRNIILTKCFIFNTNRHPDASVI